MKNAIIHYMPKKITKIAVMTGSRAEYGLLKPVMRAIEKDSSLELHVVAAGMHLEKQHGITMRAIESDGFKVHATVKMYSDKDSGAAMAEAIARGISRFNKIWKELKPDWVLVLGDRIEPLAAVISAAYSGYPIAHIHGGDLSAGGLDESARHAITRFAHLHLAATKGAASRLRKMGEEAFRIHCVGAPGLDTLLHTRIPAKRTIEKELNIKLSSPTILLVQHPVTSQVDEAESQMEATLSALREIDAIVIAFYPNSDAGGRRMARLIQAAHKRKEIIAYRNLPHLTYLGLLKHADVMVGNSSSGIIEAPSLQTAVVNLGIRQQGRERCGNIIDTPCEKDAIIKAVKKALRPSFQKKLLNLKSPYGDGKAAKRITKLLKDTSITPDLLQKRLVFANSKRT